MVKKILLLIVISSLLVLNIQADVVEVDGISYSLNTKSGTAEVVNNASQYSGNIVIPETIIYEGSTYNVTSLGKEAFKACTSLISLSMPNSITTLGDKVFYDCRNLESVNISENISIISINAFAGARNLKKIILPESVVRINDYAFSGCSELESITILGPIQQIGTDAFWDCYKLDRVYIKDLVHFSGLYLWTVYSSPLSYTNHLFYNDKEIIDLVIPNEIDFVSRWAYRDCDFLISATIPNNVKKIEQGAFAECDNLKKLILGENITQYGDYTFSGCKALTDVYCYKKSYPESGYMMFKDCGIENVILHVPSESIEEYKSRGPWNSFKEIVPLNDSDPKPTTSINNILKDLLGCPKIYDLKGNKLDKMRNGVNIIKTSNGEVRKIFVK